MEAEESNLCCGCLCAGRKMIPIEEFRRKQCFLQILSEIPMCHPEETPVQLCWECEARLRGFVDFKQQVKHSYKLLNGYTKSLNVEQLQQPQKLSISQQINMTIPEPQIDLAEIKVEYEKQSNIKSELDSHSDNDNDFLINYVKKKKGKKRKKKVEIYHEIELSEKEIEEERREMALRDDYVNAMFRCELCIVSFPNADDLKDHVQVKHELNASNFKCSICTCSFASEVSLNYHGGKHRRRYQCAACGRRLASRRAAAAHYDRAHCHGIDPKYDVNKMTKQNGQSDDIGKAEENGSQAEWFPCELCEKRFRWKTSLRKHAETHRIEAGQKRRPYCEPCRLSFTTTSNLQKHVKTSSKHQIQLKLRKLKETNPEEGASIEKQQADIEQIKYSVNQERQHYPCPHCGKKYQWRGNLLRHLHSHTARANGELVCAPCNRSFSSIATYQQHMKISKKHVTENEFKYMCSECGKRFANKTRLKDHVDWEHLQNFVHTCPLCQKVFKSHTSLYLHKQVVHKKDSAEHLCDHCGKPFPNHSKLRSHILALHCAGAVYRCALCPARFSWHSCLSRHTRRAHRHAPQHAQHTAQHTAQHPPQHAPDAASDAQ